MIPRGILLGTEAFNPGALAEFAREVEALGYDSLWLPELFGREPVATAGYLLARTTRLNLATGIANVYARDAHAITQARRTLSELSDGRFILGLGVSNREVNAMRGHRWQSPVSKMREYLAAMAAAEPPPPAPAPRGALYIAAHGPKLQQLGASRADGVITYLMPPEHTRNSRKRIGPSADLNVVCPFLAETEPDAARTAIRRQLRYYLTLDYYHREWRKLGLADADFASGGSDRLVDTIVGWGDAAALRQRVADYEAAGATRVIVMPLDAQRAGDPGATTVRIAAPRSGSTTTGIRETP